jgi:hypothetical protein
MPTLAAKIAPQRSTQYAALASALAAPEIQLSPLGAAIGEPREVVLAGQPYVLLDLAGALMPVQERALWQMGATSEFFWFHEQVGGVPGPFLQPLTPTWTPPLPPELVEARRYRGKTNEAFGRVLINIARWAHPGAPATLLDPLMGGGTFVFIALCLGLNGLGIERGRSEVESTDTFLGQFLQGARVRHSRRAERVTGGRRTIYAIDVPALGRSLTAVLAHGDALDAPRLLGQLPRTLRPDLIVADLPYGIQHAGELPALLGGGLPAWHDVSGPEAILALAWDATRDARSEMVERVEQTGRWQVFRGGAWERLAHAVDRAIKRRDVLVARRR